MVGARDPSMRAMPIASGSPLNGGLGSDNDASPSRVILGRRLTPCITAALCTFALALVIIICFDDEGTYWQAAKAKILQQVGFKPGSKAPSATGNGIGSDALDLGRDTPIRAEQQRGSAGGLRIDVSILQDSADAQYKLPEESWTFEKELAQRPIKLSDSVDYDPFSPTALFKTGCEDEAGWTNGYRPAADSELARNLTIASKRRSPLYTSEGFTCAAYSVGGWCSKPWALGLFSNNPERHCCACGGGTSISSLSANCGQPSSECQRAVQWAMGEGIRAHPDWYPGLRESSSSEEFQSFLASKQQAGCIEACSVTPSKPNASIEPPRDSRTSNEFLPGCPRRPYDAAWKGPAFCFAQLAKNSGVEGSICSCRQGCDSSKALVRETNLTVSFTNVKDLGQARAACSKEVLLTVPREYYVDYADLKARCSRAGVVNMIEAIMRDSWDAYNGKLCTTKSEPMWQCFHSPRTASVPYLHMQAFSAMAYFHGMPTGNKAIASCVRQVAREEGRVLADKLATLIN